jgi:hypothetical protein
MGDKCLQPIEDRFEQPRMTTMTSDGRRGARRRTYKFDGTALNIYTHQAECVYLRPEGRGRGVVTFKNTPSGTCCLTKNNWEVFGRSYTRSGRCKTQLVGCAASPEEGGL